MNCTPPDFDPTGDLPSGFMEFFLPLHNKYTPRQQALLAKRRELLARAHKGKLPDHVPRESHNADLRVSLPDWAQDQRVQAVAPADEAEQIVQTINSGAQGVVLDLEDSVANTWPAVTQSIENALEALRGSLTCQDFNANRTVSIQRGSSVVSVRPRGLHLGQAGLFTDRATVASASLFDVARIFHGIDPEQLVHPLTFQIPKSETAEEAIWWRDLFRDLASLRELPENYIKCTALVESHPLAYEMDEFVTNLADHILALTLGRWDYMASLMHYNFNDPAWVLPDRNTIPYNVRFFQRLRELMVEVCHRRGILAIGGVTPLSPDTPDEEARQRVMEVIQEDKKNEAELGMDGTSTGHYHQNEAAAEHFPQPNQLNAQRPEAERYPDLRPVPSAVGRLSLQGTRDAVRAIIRYRYAVQNGKGSGAFDGYIENLGTERISRLLVAQRMEHRQEVTVVDDNGRRAFHTPLFIRQVFDEELGKLLKELPAGTDQAVLRGYQDAGKTGWQMVERGDFDPV